MKPLHLALLFVTACTVDPIGGGKGGPSVSTTDTDVLPFDHAGIGGTGGGASATGGGSSGTGGGSSGTGGGSAAGVVSGGSQRLSVAQLRSSLPVILGSDSAGNPVTWRIGTAVGFDTRSATLGEADYLNRVDDDLEPSPLYLKFMFDMAKDSCNRVITADAARAAGAKVLTRFVGPTDTVTSARANVDRNLRSLRLQFHGIKVEGGDDAGIAAYRKLFDDAVKGAAGAGSPTAAHVTEGWRAVCVALLTAPEYHLY
ncbi:MAG: hypothetical protein JNK82_25630 [Myxococcaceae bacterium]|nr:hypothetical protein [Myxococcaceae bacterium]